MADWNKTTSYAYKIINNLQTLPTLARIASFDLDDTLIIRPIGAKKSAKWQLLDTNLPTRIATYVKQSYLIVIFTNQSSLDSKPSWFDCMDTLIGDLFKGLDQFYVAIYAAKRHDINRKPNLGLWNLMVTHLGADVKISAKSFYCGDAAGRVKASLLKQKHHPGAHTGDFSDTDRKFAENIGINFYTPEEFIFPEKQQSERFVYKGFDPEAMIKSLNVKPHAYKFIGREMEVIVLVGPPGSGKTEFCANYLPEYLHVSKDVMGAKYLDYYKEYIAEGANVVIDATNPDALSRMKLIALAEGAEYVNIRCIELATDINLAYHMNNVRHCYDVLSEATIISSKIPDVVYHKFKKMYEKPTKIEGFDVIETVPYIFDQSKLEDELWYRVFMWKSEFI
jgi:bifunctional polynucleotide phosphatase/kinase